MLDKTWFKIERSIVFFISVISGEVIILVCDAAIWKQYSLEQMKESIVGNLNVPLSLVMKNYERFSQIESKKKMWLSERSVFCVDIKLIR